MITIAISGGIACGKSLVAAQIVASGVPVCEADDLAHAVLRKGSPVHSSVVEAFGSAIVGPDGEIDRAGLGDMVFSDPLKLEKLNGLTHPEILRRLRQWIDDQSGRAGFAVGVIPLLYEVGDEDRWDVVVCVAAPGKDQQRRLEERGLPARNAQARIAAQMPLAQKMERADYVIYNGGSVDLLKEQTEKVMRRIRGE